MACSLNNGVEAVIINQRACAVRCPVHCFVVLLMSLLLLVLSLSFSGRVCVFVGARACVRECVRMGIPFAALRCCPTAFSLGKPHSGALILRRVSCVAEARSGVMHMPCLLWSLPPDKKQSELHIHAGLGVGLATAGRGAVRQGESPN